MKLGYILGGFGLTVAGMFTALAMFSNSPEDDLKSENVVASYRVGGNLVTEFRTVSDPETLVIAVDGYRSLATDSWTQAQGGALGHPEVLTEYTLTAGRVYEFQPASNENMVCTYIDGYRSGALTCAPRRR